MTNTNTARLLDKTTSQFQIVSILKRTKIEYGLPMSEIRARAKKLAEKGSLKSGNVDLRVYKTIKHGIDHGVITKIKRGKVDFFRFAM